MKIRKEHLQRAEQSALLLPGGASALWANLSQQLAEEPAFKAQHLLYYFGALLMLLPLTLFVSSGFLRLGDVGLLLIALLIGAGTFFAADKLLKTGRRIAAGIFSTVSLGMVPLALYSLLPLFGADLSTSNSSTYQDFHRNISFHFVGIEILTLGVGAVYLHRFRLPFLMLPLTVILWYLGMDIASRVVASGFADTIQRWSIFYGLLIMAIAYVVERRTQHMLADFSFWPWIFGTLSFWGALSTLDSGGEWGKFVYAVICLGMVLGSIIVGRRVLAVAGALGLLGYLGHLSLHVFKNAVAFPFVTLVLGAALVWVGLRWPRIEKGVATALGLKRQEE